ncbi:MAG: universal stress protein [Halolamina sp.]|uniref:universal stress protein n=1 Tax=Halolamina sp. TaxID=1940283 RepID=UPI002FC2E254
MGQINGGPVLGTLLDPTGDTQVRELSIALAGKNGAPVRFLSPRRTSDTTAQQTAPASASVSVSASASATTNGPPVRFASVETTEQTGRPPERIVTEEAANASADIVVVERSAAESAGWGIRRGLTDRIVANAPTDSVVANGQGDLSELASILVPVAGGPHSELAVEVACALAEHTDAWVELFTVIPENPTADERSAGAESLARARQSADGFENLDTWLYEDDDPAMAIAEQSEYYDAVVMGAPTKGRIRRTVFGSTADSVDRSVDIPVITAVSADR